MGLQQVALATVFSEIVVEIIARLLHLFLCVAVIRFERVETVRNDAKLRLSTLERQAKRKLLERI